MILMNLTPLFLMLATHLPQIASASVEGSMLAKRVDIKVIYRDPTQDEKDRFCQNVSLPFMAKSV